jgi:ABC-type Fe3+-hydroxamate transport system substrate-binding protein
MDGQYSRWQLPSWDAPPKKVVSLVPSLTESVFELGFGSSVVGISSYCVHPRELLAGLPRLGGPKNPDVKAIVGLGPDLVIADQEENDKDSILRLYEQGVQVWLTFTKTVDESLDLLRQFLALYHTDKPVMKINSLQIGVDYARAAARAQDEISYFCPIWYRADAGTEWWMTFNRDTYSDNLLQMFGGKNIFAERQRKYPLEADLGLAEEEPAGERDTRYPRVTLDEVREAQPQVIFLPDDPFKFDRTHKKILMEELKDTPAVQDNRIYFLDGTLVTWHGVRLGKALNELPDYFYQVLS